MHKPIRGEEANCSCKINQSTINQLPTSKKEENETGDERVGEVEYGADDAADLQLGHKEVHAVDEQVDRRETRRHKRTPPL